MTIDISTLRKGDKVLIEATFDFHDTNSTAAYFNIAGHYSSTRAEATAISSVVSQAFAKGDPVRVGEHYGVVKYADDEIVLVKFNDDGICGSHPPSSVTRDVHARSEAEQDRATAEPAAQ